MNGKCKECGIEKKLKISECPILNTCTESIPCMEWKFVARRGKKKNGKDNTQLELTRTFVPVNEIIKSLIDS